MRVLRRLLHREDKREVKVVITENFLESLKGENALKYVYDSPQRWDQAGKRMLYNREGSKRLK